MMKNVVLRGALQGFAVGAWLWLLLIAFFMGLRSAVVDWRTDQYY